jgi:hypothetical protein
MTRITRAQVDRPRLKAVLALSTDNHSDARVVLWLAAELLSRLRSGHIERLVMRAKVMGLMLVAMICVGGVSATSALAASGELVNSKKEALIKNKYTAKGAAAKESAILETVGGSKIVCTKFTAKGEVTKGSRTEGIQETKFKGCKFGGFACSSEKATAEELVSNTKLDVVTSNAKAEDIVVNSLATPIKVSCIGIKIEVRNRFGSDPLPVPTALSKVQRIKATGSKGKQTTTEWNKKGTVEKGVLESSFAGGAFENSSEEATAEIEFEEEVVFV